jgi:LuxR family maltose regulon positive regulatory protein
MSRTDASNSSSANCYVLYMGGVRRHDDAGSGLAGPADGWWFREAVLRLPQTRPERRILVVGAPPGSGRARLVRRWLSAPWTWVSLENEGPPASSPRAAEAVDSAFRSHAGGGFIVLEGVEALGPEELEQVVAGRPEGPRLVLVGRGEVLSPALAVRLAGQVAEVRADDLWWPVEVVQSQLAELCGVRVGAAEVEWVHRRSGGWPAGVLALGRAGIADREGVPIELADLAVDLVLRGVPAELADFVLATGLVPGLTRDPELCAALVPAAHPVALLDEARRWGLTADRWPRRSGKPLHSNDYHEIVAAAAHRSLARRGRELNENLGRVGKVASDRGRGPLAVDCYLAAGSWREVLAELERAAPQGYRGWEMGHLHDVLGQIPEPYWGRDAESRALIAHAAALTGDHLLAAEVIGRTPGNAVPWWGAMTALIAVLAGEEIPDEVPSECLPNFLGVKDADSFNAVISVLKARSAAFRGGRAAVESHLTHAWSAGVHRLPRYLLLAGIGVHALTSAWAGELSAAERLAERASRLAEQAGLGRHPMLAPAVLAEAEVLRARGEPAQALKVLDRNLEIITAGDQFVVNASGGAAPGQAHRVLRARLWLDLGDSQAAHEELERLRRNGDDLPAGLAVRLASARARLAEMNGDLAAAQAILEGAPAVPAVLTARLGIALQRQHPEAAATVLAAWPPDAGLEDRLRRILAEAAGTLGPGPRGPTSELVNDALVAAEPDGHVRVFLEVPPALRVTISTTLRRSPDASAWRRALTTRLDQAGAAGEDEIGVTRRELVVLERLTTELTHAQIAAELFVSENTLKSHCRNLYRKLGVHSREEAVRIARVRGWLNASPRGDVVVDVNITRTPDVVDVIEL